MTIVDYSSGSTTTTYSYSGNESPNEIAFSNDGTSNATLTVYGVDYVVKPQEVFEMRFPHVVSTIDITTTGEYRLAIGR